MTAVGTVLAPVELTEHEDWTGELSDEDVNFILSELSCPPRQFTLRRELRGQAYTLNAHQFVGVLTLPSGRLLRNAPKVPLGTLFYMLAVAYDLPMPFREEPATVERIDDMFEVVAEHFADLVQARVDQGLYRQYAEREENLTTVRGRIELVEDSRRNALLRHRTYCRFGEFTWDIPANQVIRQVVHLLGGWPFSPRTRQRLLRLDARLGEITLTSFTPQVLDQFQYHRLNEDYVPLHRLCRLFLEGASLSDRLGQHDLRAFLVDMNKLFETFVTQVLRERMPAGASIAAQERMYLDHERTVKLRPDIVIRRGTIVSAVADCKYKHVGAAAMANNADLYQILAYCIRLNAPRGLLIYPAGPTSHGESLKIWNIPIAVQTMCIDLHGGRERLIQQCDEFAEHVFTLV